MPSRARWPSSVAACKGLRIGIDRKYHLAGIDAEQAASIEEALKVLAGLGARIVEVRMPDLTGMVPAWFTLASAEAAAAHKANFPSRANEYGLYFREILQVGSSWTEAQLEGAKKIRARITAGFDQLLQSVDALACPSGGAPAWPITRDLQIGPLAAYMEAWGKASPRNSEFPAPMNLAGTPAICLPSGFTAARTAAQHPVRRAPLVGADAVPHRACLRAGDRLARAASESLVRPAPFDETIAANG